jgi:hypothetical protein
MGEITADDLAGLSTRLLLHLHRLAVANREATGYRGGQGLIAAIDAELRRRGVWK